ncbi:MAG: hypothetical protein ACPL1G_10215 [Thermodesulfovibrionales bacterium]
MSNKDKSKALKLNLNPSLFFLLTVVTVLLFLTASAYSLERKITRSHEKKMEKIASILAEEISNRKIRTVVLKDFVDLKAKTGTFERALTERFRKALIKVRKGRFKIFTKDGEVIIRGTVIPYVEKERFDLKIELIKPSAPGEESGDVIFTYTGIFN